MKRQEVFQRIVDDVAYKDWAFRVTENLAGALFLQVVFPATCSDTGETAVQRGRKWLLSDHMTKSEVVFTALKAVLTAEEHEAREQFRYRGRAIAGPHIDVDALWKAAPHEDRRSDP